jgi:hypothetical protein
LTAFLVPGMTFEANLADKDHPVPAWPAPVMAGIIIVRLGQTPSRPPTMTWPTGRPNHD